MVRFLLVAVSMFLFQGLASAQTTRCQNFEQAGCIRLHLGVMHDGQTPLYQALKAADTGSQYSDAATPFYREWRAQRLQMHQECFLHRLFVWRMNPGFTPQDVVLYDENRRRVQVRVVDPRTVEVPLSTVDLGPVQAVLEARICGEGGFQFDWRHINVDATYLVLCAVLPSTHQLLAPNRERSATRGIHIRPQDWRTFSRNKKEGYLDGAGWEHVFLPEIIDRVSSS